MQMSSRTPRHDQPAPTRMFAGAGCVTVSFRPRVAPQQSPLPLRRHGHSTSRFTPGIATRPANLRLSSRYVLLPVHPRYSQHAGQPVTNFRVSPQGCTPGNLTGNLQNPGEFTPFRVPARLIAPQFQDVGGEFPVPWHAGNFCPRNRESIRRTSLQVHGMQGQFRARCKDMVARTLRARGRNVVARTIGVRCKDVVATTLGTRCPGIAGRDILVAQHATGIAAAKRILGKG
jgi:hypothetical protein